MTKMKTSAADSRDLNDSELETGVPDGPVDDTQGATEAGPTEPESPQVPPRVDIAEAIYQSKERLFRERKIGAHRPLNELAGAEEELEKRTQASQILSTQKRKGRDDNLAIYQLNRSLNTAHVSTAIATKVNRDNLQLYASLDSIDSIESILNRHIVAMSNNAMECHYRSTFGTDKSFDVFSRHAERMTQVLIQLIDMRERRRNPKQPMVQRVNVNAIVGTVETHEPRVRSDDDDDDGAAD